jgi:ACT domain-containing protein
MKDTFKKFYTTTSEEAKKLVLEIKTQAEILENLFDKIKSREMAVAHTNLEQAVMWAAKAVFNDKELNNL